MRHRWRSIANGGPSLARIETELNPKFNIPEGLDEEGGVPEVRGLGVMRHKGVGGQRVPGHLPQVAPGRPQWVPTELLLIPLQQHGCHLHCKAWSLGTTGRPLWTPIVCVHAKQAMHMRSNAYRVAAQYSTSGAVTMHCLTHDVAEGPLAAHKSDG